MKTIISSVLSFLSICLLSACSNSDQGGSIGAVVNQNESIRIDGSNIKGIYQANLIPLNHNLHFMKVGVGAIQRDKDSFWASIRLKYGSKDVSHKQSIYTGRRCPNINDDKNKDAYIDINEALEVIGQITIPLDGDLNSQSGGNYEFPMGDGAKGAYFYKEMASFEQMFADLREADWDETDHMIKLKKNEGLTLPGRILVVHGLSRKVSLPATVGGTENEDAYESIPVACGVLWKVEKLSEDLSSEI